MIPSLLVYDAELRLSFSEKKKRDRTELRLLQNIKNDIFFEITF